MHLKREKSYWHILLLMSPSKFHISNELPLEWLDHIYVELELQAYEILPKYYEVPEGFLFLTHG